MTTPSSGSQLDALRRSTGDRMVAGVAGGIARTLNLDPVIVRIGFVVLTVVGFAGPILYVACWLLVPKEGSTHSVLGDAFDVQSESRLRTIGFTVAAVVAVIEVLGSNALGRGDWFVWPVWAIAWAAALGGGLYWLFVVRPNRVQQRLVPPPPATTSGMTAPFSAAPAGAATVPTGDTEMTQPMPMGEGTAVLADPLPPGPPVGPPTAPVPPRPPREKWSPALVLLTLSAIVAAMGMIGLWEATQGDVDPAAYPATALGIVAVGLFVGTRVGHPGALVPVGLLIVPVLAAAAFLPTLDAGQVNISPATADALPASITQGAGEVRVDLTDVTDPQALSGRTLRIRNGLGSTTVYVPKGLDVGVEASLKLGGRVQVFERVTDGRGAELEKDANAPGAFEIEIDGSAGEIVVIDR